MNGISNKDLEIILDNCTEYFRDGVQYMDYDGSDYMLNVTVDENNNCDCHFFDKDEERYLTNHQKDRVMNKAWHLLQDEIQEMTDFKNNYEPNQF